jgi:hypothetical protein
MVRLILINQLQPQGSRTDKKTPSAPASDTTHVRLSSAVGTLKLVFIEHARMGLERIPGAILITPSRNRQRLDDCIDTGSNVVIRPGGDRYHAVTGSVFVFQHGHLDKRGRR